MNAIAVRAAGVSLLILLLAAVCQASADASDTSNGEAAALIFIVVLVPLVIFVIRRSLLRQLRRQMMANSAEPGAVVVDELDAAEDDAGTVPQVQVDEADLTTPAMGEPRRQRERAEQRLFLQAALSDLGIGLLYTGAGAVAGSATVLCLGVAFLLFTVMRYVLHLRRFRAFDLSRSRARQRWHRRLAWVRKIVLVLVSVATGSTASNLEYAPEVLRGIFGLRMRVVLSVAMMAVAALAAVDGRVQGEASWPATLCLLVVAAVHAAIFFPLTGKIRRLPGIRLLVLRVFDLESSSAFTFSGLMGYWRYFGNHFTVVDASLVQQDYSHRKWSDAILFLSSCATVMLLSMVVIGRYHLDQLPLGWLWCCLVAATLTLLPAWGIFAVEKRRLAGRFLRSREELVGQLEKLEVYPRRMDLSFRHIQAPCHDNTWFLAVVEFARRAEVVMMDLRGYSEQRKGCQREVDFLFDVVPVERLLFLVDMATDLDVVKAMLLERWRQLRHTSPNLGLKAPVIRLYLSRDNDERDMQALLDRLIAAAEEEPAARETRETTSVTGKRVDRGGV